MRSVGRMSSSALRDTLRDTLRETLRGHKVRRVQQSLREKMDCNYPAPDTPQRGSLGENCWRRDPGEKSENLFDSETVHFAQLVMSARIRLASMAKKFELFEIVNDNRVRFSSENLHKKNAFFFDLLSFCLQIGMPMTKSIDLEEINKRGCWILTTVRTVYKDHIFWAKIEITRRFSSYRAHFQCENQFLALCFDEYSQVVSSIKILISRSYCIMVWIYVFAWYLPCEVYFNCLFLWFRQSRVL